MWLGFAAGLVRFVNQYVCILKENIDTFVNACNYTFLFVFYFQSSLLVELQDLQMTYIARRKNEYNDFIL